MQLQHVTKRYPNGKVALHDVDLAVPEGDFVFLVGPSGAGKSTLIKLLIRDELATSGDVLLDGQNLARVKRRNVPKLRRRIGIVFQDYKLLPEQDGLGERGVRARGDGDAGASSSGRPSIACSRSSGLTAQARQLPSRSRAASSSGPRSPAPSSTTRD